MALVDDLLPASFRGIPFLVRNNNTGFGGKVVLNEYPNMPGTYAEGLGKKGRQYNITAVISGDDYIAQRFALMAAIEDTSIGIYIDPIDGIRFVVPLPSTMVEQQTSVGEAAISIVLQESILPINPNNSGDLFSQILSTAESLDNAMQSVFAEIFVVSNFFPNNFLTAKALVGNVSNQFTGLKTVIGKSGNTTDLNTEQAQFDANAVTNIQNPASLASAISGLFAVANNASDDPKFMGSVFVGMFGYGSNQPVIPVATCPQSQQRLLNDMIVNYMMNIYALMYAYLNYSEASFSDDGELTATYQMLEAQYLTIINGQISPLINIPAYDILDDDTLDQIETMRNFARLQFNKDAVNVAKLIDINIINLSSVSILSYMYYGNTDQDEAIIALNDANNPSFVKGDITVRTGASS